MGQFQRWTFGNTEVIALQDTWSRLRPDYFFPDADPAAFGRYGEHLMEGGRMALSHTAWLIASGGRTILVDTGIGYRPGPLPVREEASLPAVLVEAGVRAEEVDTVVFTHLHYDHVGWNTVEQGDGLAPLFPNARHIVQQREWDYWTSPEADPMAAPDRAAGARPAAGAGADRLRGGGARGHAGGGDGADAGAHAGPRVVPADGAGGVGAVPGRRGALADAGDGGALVRGRRPRPGDGAGVAADAVGPVAAGRGAGGVESLPVPGAGPGRRGGGRASLGGAGGGRVDQVRAMMSPSAPMVIAVESAMVAYMRRSSWNRAVVNVVSWRA